MVSPDFFTFIYLFLRIVEVWEIGLTGLVKNMKQHRGHKPKKAKGKLCFEVSLGEPRRFIAQQLPSWQ